ncbi:MAG TPA: dipeptide epimerase [Cytophagales bacterium]|nr:dipeptide epimerase [Cytophagales bacterium]
MKLILHSFDLKLKHTFKIFHGAHDIQKTLIVELQENGLSGYGEATANPYYGITIEKMMNDLEQIREKIENSKLDSPEKFWETMYPYLKKDHFALCALDIAANDLYGKLKESPLYELWGLKIENLPLTNYTIGIDTIEKMVEKLKEKPWPLYKIKLGTKEDVKIIQELRKHTNSTFRVDANCGWTVDEASENAVELKKLNVEFIEQPLHAEDWEGMKVLYSKSVLPLIADESCQTEGDVQKCKGHFHGINIKLTKCGGLTPARRMIADGRNYGMKIMVGCMTESSVGISAIAQLLPMLDYVDMDGALLLEHDIAEGVTIENGSVSFPERNGLGVILKS